MAKPEKKPAAILQTPSFARAVKKLRKNQKADLDQTIEHLMNQLLSGSQKKGDLAWLRIYKFQMSKKATLLGYVYNEHAHSLELVALRSHENFYREAAHKH